MIMKMLILILVACILEANQYPRILHIPLDQRFTTRVVFLNLNRMTPFQIDTLPDKYLPQIKNYQAPQQSIEWVIQKFKSEEYQKHNNSCIISVQTLLYGSLIASRISNDSYQQIKQNRFNKLISLWQENKNTKIYLSAVVMRIPNYNLDFQEPAYWKQFGQLLYNYSYFSDKYKKTHNVQDLQAANQAKSQIPSQILTQFLWRRSRNHKILLDFIDFINQKRDIISNLYITLDDNAQYGFNIAQATQIRQKVKQLDLNHIIKIYPGADQVSLSLLAKFITDYVNVKPTVAMYFRNQSTIGYIPKYEGQPLIKTVQSQIQAAGGIPINGSLTKRGNVTLLINNFDEEIQIEAPNQFIYNNLTVDYNQTFFSKVCYPNDKEIYAFADSRFSNGADIDFVNWFIEAINKCNRNFQRWTYAGWNTNGNTLGTAISNSIILFLSKIIKANFKQKIQIKFSQKDCEVCSPCTKFDIKCANEYFNLLRIIQDRDWQAILRQTLIAYISHVPGDSFNELSSDLDFYQKFAYKSLYAQFQKLKSTFKQSQQTIELSGVYYPWRRAFQIGIYGSIQNKGKHQINMIE